MGQRFSDRNSIWFKITNEKNKPVRCPGSEISDFFSELFLKKINISIVHSQKIIYLSLKITQDERPDRKNTYCRAIFG